MIIIDATEARSNTRLPQTVIDAAQVVDGFEALTGADILVSPLSVPKLPDKLTSATLHQKLLMKHTRAGILVQRKSGLDFITSMEDLHTIEKRMQKWVGKIGSLLLITGIFDFRNNGQLFINHKKVDLKKLKRRVDKKSFHAALDWWQLRGGNVTQLPNDKDIVVWVNHWHESMLHKLNSDPEKLVVDLPPVQMLRGAEDTWWTPLAVVPGIGEKKAQVLAEWLPESERSLAHAICYLCDERNVKRDRPPGFGKKTFQGTRELFGLSERDTLCIISSVEEQAEHYPIRLVWPASHDIVGMRMGQWWRREDGKIEAVYNTKEELQACLELVEAFTEEREK